MQEVSQFIKTSGSLGRTLLRYSLSLCLIIIPGLLILWLCMENGMKTWLRNAF